MAVSLTTFFYAFVIYVIYSYIRSWITESRFQEFAKRNGCELAQRDTFAKLPWGIDDLYRVIRAVSNGTDLLDDMVVPRFKALNATTTWDIGLFGKQVVDTIEPRNIQALLATNFKDFGTGERRSKQFGALLGHNIFTSDGEFWAHSRAMFRPLFNREQINDLEETERAAKILIDVLPKGEGGWTEPLNLMEYIYRFTLDTATHFLFGHTTDSQLAAAGKLVSEEGSITSMATDQEFVDAFSVAQEWLIWRIRLQGMYWLVQSRRWRRATEVVRNFVNQYVKLALDQQAQEEKTGEQIHDGRKYNLLRELANECRDPTELRDQLLGMYFYCTLSQWLIILGILSAGRDTTAALLSWLFIELARHPKIYTKLRRTVLEDLGDASSDVPTLRFTELKACRYLQHVILETLRVHPPVPFNNRQALRDTTLPVGGGPNHDKPIAIRKGQIVNFSVYAMQYRKDLWGEDADVFKPERWDGKKIGWDFLPFSGGPRVCLGRKS
jgi:cytochrome P450